MSVRNFSYSSMVETLSQQKDPAEDEWLARMYLLLLRANGSEELAKADLLEFLQDGRLPERVLLFARLCVEEDAAARNRSERTSASIEAEVRTHDH
jgi:hypothetical protein